MKFGDGGGGTVRERFNPEITPDAGTRSFATPKGEALGAFMASRNHPIGVIWRGELKAGESLFQHAERIL
jgi:hypothetical protein